MEKTLDQFAIGETGVVKRVSGEGKIKRRLFDMGITPGAGVVRSIELAQDGDQRLVVEFGNAETKTLLAKFAKLTKL